MCATETLSKIDVARRQLAEAVRLFFERRDAIAIHTLAAAAQGVLRDLATNQNIEQPSILHDSPHIPNESRKTWIQHINRPRNYFKHANNDHTDSLLWDDNENERWLLDSVQLYISVTGGELFGAASTYLGWATTKNPRLRTAISGNVLGEFCVREGISHEDYAWFLEHIDAPILFGRNGFVQRDP